MTNQTNNQTIEETAKGYLKMVIKNCLANDRKVNPCDISDEEVENVYETNSLPGYRIHQAKLTGYVNGKEKISIVVALIDIETEEWYYSQSIN